MKIAHIVCTYPPYYGGMGNVVYQTVSSLADLGHDVSVYTPLYYTPEPVKEVSEEEKVQKIEQEEMEKYAKRLETSVKFGNAARLSGISQEIADADIVHLHYPFYGTANLVRRWKLRNPNKPLVITYHMDTRAPSWKGLYFKYYAKYWMPKILGSADALIASSFDYIESSAASQFFQQNSISIIPTTNSDHSCTF